MSSGAPCVDGWFALRFAGYQQFSWKSPYTIPLQGAEAPTHYIEVELYKEAVRFLLGLKHFGPATS